MVRNRRATPEDTRIRTSGTSRPDRTGSLIVAGSGIQLIRQLTPEARDAVEQADAVFFVVADPAMADWLSSLNENARSLSTLYRPGTRRREVYAEMVEEILTAVRGGARVCAVFYGHPGVYVAPSHLAVAQARAEGFSARMLPGISSEDCLFADLGVDPAAHGWQSYDSTDFLVRGYEPDPAAGLVLWQVDALGKLDASPGQEPGGLSVLADRLGELYAAGHELVFYRASTYPIADALVEKVRLELLATLPAAPGPTLYVPPAHRRPIDPERARLLGISS